MRFMVIFCGLLFLMCGCNDGTPTTSTGGSNQGAVSKTPMITGTVLFEQPLALSANASLNVRLLDVTRADAKPKLIKQINVPVTAIPASFELPYDPGDINPIRSYAVDANVLDQGQVRFISQGKVGVLTQGKSSKIKLMLAQALVKITKDPAVELNKAFASFEAGLGGLERFADSRIIGKEGQEVAIGWDAFADETGVRMVREQINNADGSRLSRRFAYRNGEVWVAIRESGNVTIKLGWDEANKLLVTEKNSQIDVQVANQAAELTKQAQEAYQIASAHYKH